MDRNSQRLYLSGITIAEVEDGIAKARREGASRKASLLLEWLDAVLHLYADRVLPFDVAAARIAGRLSDLARGKGHSPGFPDIAIAATAQVHDLTVLTRNLKHFAVFGIAAHDPFPRYRDEWYAIAESSGWHGETHANKAIVTYFNHLGTHATA